MSHPYGSIRGRGAQKHHKNDDRGGRSKPGTSQVDERNNRARGGGHPAHLRGKAIGLFYRNLQNAKKKEVITLQLPTNLEDRIERILHRCPQFFEKQYNSEAPVESNGDPLESKYTHIQDSMFKTKFLRILSGNIQDNLKNAINSKCRWERNEKLDQDLAEGFRTKCKTQEYENMLKSRLKLPAYKKREDILQAINENQVILIKGETGCGKTTQIPQLILDGHLEKYNGSVTKIICTQPRRISAISVAERVAAERAEDLGQSVGFHIRLEKKLPRRHGSIIFCTTGILLQRLQYDPALQEFSHIVIDEVHERSIDSDFILALLKFIIPARPDLKIILMSASLNAEQFSKYYNNCPIIEIPGFTYWVQEFYLEDVLQFTKFQFDVDTKKPKPRAWEKSTEYSDVIEPYIRQLTMQRQYSREVLDQLRKPTCEDMSLELIEELIRYICHTKEPGAILVFLPGIMDITKLYNIMEASGRYPQAHYVIYPVHSRMPTIDQKLIFKEPPCGVRKIILATSIAESSITIEDVVYVIDCGRMKVDRFDVVKKVQTLGPEWVSLANAQQRRGRAGRVRPGVCYHLFIKARELTFDKYPLPEMLRTRLEQVILQIKILQLGSVRSFLESVMDPPGATAIDLSLELLTTLNAIDNDENLTPLGYHLAQLPVDPRTGKMLILASMFSCVEPVFAIAASLSFKDAFYFPMGKDAEARERKLELSMDQYSDHIALAEALKRFEQAFRRGAASYFCRKYFLSMSTLKQLSEMKVQFAQYLQEMKLMNSSNPNNYNDNKNSSNIALVKAVVCAGLYPNIATVRAVENFGTRAYTVEDGPVYVHPMSVNDKVKYLPTRYLMYFTKRRSSKIYLHDTTAVTLPIIFFAAPNLTISTVKGEHTISVSCVQDIHCTLRTATVIQNLQRQFNNMLEYKISHPGTVDWLSLEGDLLNAIIDLVCYD